MHSFSAATAFALTAFCTAQGSIVSPAISATNEGSSNNVFPFISGVARRYMQIHGDLGATPRSLKKLRFRPNAANTTNNATWVIDLEMFMGLNRSFPAASYFFDQNYLIPKTTTITRKSVNFGPVGTIMLPGPNPFSPGLELALDQPFQHVGLALVWEVVVYSNTVSGGPAMDADAGTLTTAASAVTGSGCIASGQSTPMTHGLTLADVGGYFGMNLTLASGPANAPAVLAIGATNPNLPVPGLCSNLQTDVLLILPLGNLPATGALTTNEAGQGSLIAANSFGGATIYTQVHAVDTGRSDPIQVANSDGRTATVPFPNTTKVVGAHRIFNNAGGTTATQGIWFTSTLGYALPTEFIY